MEWQTITSIKGYKVELYAIKYNQHGDKKNATHFNFNAFKQKTKKTKLLCVFSIFFNKVQIFEIKQHKQGKPLDLSICN